MLSLKDISSCKYMVFFGFFVFFEKVLMEVIMFIKLRFIVMKDGF